MRWTTSVWPSIPLEQNRRPEHRPIDPVEPTDFLSGNEKPRHTLQRTSCFDLPSSDLGQNHQSRFFLENFHFKHQTTKPCLGHSVLLAERPFKSMPMDPLNATYVPIDPISLKCHRCHRLPLILLIGQFRCGPRAMKSKQLSRNLRNLCEQQLKSPV